MRPAPQGRAYKERRHFHHVTVLLSSEEMEAIKGNGKRSKAGKPGATATASRTRKQTGGATSGAGKSTEQRTATKTPETAAVETPVATPVNETATQE